MLKHSCATSMKYSITLALCFFFTGCRTCHWSVTLCREQSTLTPPQKKQHPCSSFPHTPQLHTVLNMQRTPHCCVQKPSGQQRQPRYQADREQGQQAKNSAKKKGMKNSRAEEGVSTEERKDASTHKGYSQERRAGQTRSCAKKG